MATSPGFSQAGGTQTWCWADSSMTNHEVVVFNLSFVETGPNGGQITGVAVFAGTDYFPNQTSYEIIFNVVDENFNPSNVTIYGNFESTGV